jgi:hypothetical protein
VAGSTVAGIADGASSAITSTALTPRSAQAQPQISIASPAGSAWSGAGETITDSGAIDHTGTTAPVGCPLASRTGSLYQRVVNGLLAR